MRNISRDHSVSSFILIRTLILSFTDKLFPDNIKVETYLKCTIMLHTPDTTCNALPLMWLTYTKCWYTVTDWKLWNCLASSTTLLFTTILSASYVRVRNYSFHGIDNHWIWNISYYRYVHIYARHMITSQWCDFHFFYIMATHVKWSEILTTNWLCTVHAVIMLIIRMFLAVHQVDSGKRDAQDEDRESRANVHNQWRKASLRLKAKDTTSTEEGKAGSQTLMGA